MSPLLSPGVDRAVPLAAPRWQLLPLLVAAAAALACARRPAAAPPPLATTAVAPPSTAVGAAPEALPAGQQVAPTVPPPAAPQAAATPLPATAPTQPDPLVPASHPVTVLLTHPRAHTLHFYDTLVRQGVWNVQNLRLVGIFHAQETEDYRDASDYIREHNIDWISLRVVHCPITAATLYEPNTCSDEFARLLAESSGIIFNGGPDIPPALYHRPTLLSTIIESPQRHLFELSLLFHLLGGSQNRRVTPMLAARPAYPVLGICVGMQSLNVAAGGTLLQDIPSEVYGVHTIEQLQASDPNRLHRNPEHLLDADPQTSSGVFHGIRLTAVAPEGVRALVPPKPGALQVFSLHHQAVDRLAPDYQVTATSLDGRVVEGIRHRHFAHVWGWQFHPERSLLWDHSEIQRQRAGGAVDNIGYERLARDPASRSFHRALWALFAADVVRASATQRP